MSLAFLGLQLTYIVRLVNLRVYVSQFLIINFYTHTHTHTHTHTLSFLILPRVLPNTGRRYVDGKAEQRRSPWEQDMG